MDPKPPKHPTRISLHFSWLPDVVVGSCVGGFRFVAPLGGLGCLNFRRRKWQDSGGPDIQCSSFDCLGGILPKP